MAGKVDTVGDLLDNINFLDADTKVRSANGKSIWVGVKRYKNFRGEMVTEFVIEGELKEVERVKFIKVFERDNEF